MRHVEAADEGQETDRNVLSLVRPCMARLGRDSAKWKKNDKWRWDSKILGDIWIHNSTAYIALH